MKCKRCGADMPDVKKTCSECGSFLEGYTLNNVTGEYGYRGADGNFYKSEEDYRRQSSAAVPLTEKECEYYERQDVWKRWLEDAGIDNLK